MDRYRQIHVDEYHNDTKRYSVAASGKGLSTTKDGLKMIDVNAPNFCSYHKNKTVIRDNNGRNVKISLDEYDKDKHNHINDGFGVYRNIISGEIKRLSNTNVDKSLWSGVNSKTITVRDKNNKCFNISVDDPRYLSGELIPASVGYKKTKEQKMRWKISRGIDMSPIIVFNITSCKTIKFDNVVELCDVSKDVMGKYVSVGRINKLIRDNILFNSKYRIYYSNDKILKYSGLVDIAKTMGIIENARMGRSGAYKLVIDDPEALGIEEDIMTLTGDVMTDDNFWTQVFKYTNLEEIVEALYKIPVNLSSHEEDILEEVDSNVVDMIDGSAE